MYNTTALTHAIRALCCATIVFLVGRFPVTPILPGPNVARPGDVSAHLIQRYLETKYP